MTTIPDVSSIIKVLKSHNISFKSGDNASTWYLHLHNFCNIIGIYLTPLKAMEKNSEMGKEWDSLCLPNVLYEWLNKMEKILSHILTFLEFFPKDMNDELQLNPNLYNFLCLFMATHSHSVPELSNQVIQHPPSMNNKHKCNMHYCGFTISIMKWMSLAFDRQNIISSITSWVAYHWILRDGDHSSIQQGLQSTHFFRTTQSTQYHP